MTIIIFIAHFLFSEYVPQLWFLSFGICLGYLSHQVADAFSKAGVAWLYPFTEYRRYANGAFVLKKKKRYIFKPLYRVGSKPLGIKGETYWKMILFALCCLRFYLY
jgi:membrane-bound metal-dependent hydrolase YbcI (DUF457 family)